MKRKIPESDIPKGLKPWMVQEAAQAAYGVQATVNVRTAKDQLSSLLERASMGEEIVITSDGKPKAMIVRYRPVITGAPARSMAAVRSKMAMTPDSTSTLRAMRDSGF
ncbi:MAG: Antitoxin [Verrucomicrobia bacterium]|nr:Antitoxin [Verrucomicrobiota bacterium]